MTGTTPRRTGATRLCLLLCALLIVVVVRHVQAMDSQAPLSFGIDTQDVVLLSVLAALLAGAAAVTARAHRRGLSARAMKAVAAAIVLLVALLAAFGHPDLNDGSAGGIDAPYRQMLLDFSSPVLHWLVGLVVIAALALLPVAAVGAAAGAGGGARMTRGRRVATLLACAAAALVLLAALVREVALLRLLQGESQGLTSADALVWVAALWALMALGWSARALRRGRDPGLRLALLVPPAVLVGAVLLVIGQPGFHRCCFTYGPPQAVEGFVDQGVPDAQPAPYDVSVEVPVDESQIYAVEDTYTPPPLGSDLLLLAGCLAIGVALPLGLRQLQLRRVSTSASTPPG